MTPITAQAHTTQEYRRVLYFTPRREKDNIRSEKRPYVKSVFNSTH